MVKTSVSKEIKLWLGITSPDARWGIFAILLSLSISFGAFALSFYQLSHQGDAQMIWVFWLFVAFGGVSFILALSFGFYWIKHPHKDISPDILAKLTSVEISVNSLANEIRQERDERKKCEGRAKGD